MKNEACVRLLRSVERSAGNLRSSSVPCALRVRYLGSGLRHWSQRPLVSHGTLCSLHTRDHLQRRQAPRTRTEMVSFVLLCGCSQQFWFLRFFVFFLSLPHYVSYPPVRPSVPSVRYVILLENKKALKPKLVWTFPRAGVTGAPIFSSKGS